jgi:Large polyvalent protein associated domain 30/Large polyvalent protein associated domain 29
MGSGALGRVSFAFTLVRSRLELKMIQVGQKVYSGLYGGRNGYIFGIHGEQKPQSVGSVFGGVMRVGGNAHFDIVFENGSESLRLPECILHGVQWKIFPDVVSADVVQFWREFAAQEKVRREAEAKKSADAFAASVSALRVDPRYKTLQQTGPETHGGAKLVASNVRRELKTAFPGVKFSVRCSSYDAVTIAWIDGPTTDQVKTITGKYSGGYFDGMEDIYRHERSPWTSVFGSAKYISESRHHSVAAMTKAVEKVCEDYGWPLIEVKTAFEGNAFLDANDHDQQRVVYDYLERRYPFAEIEASEKEQGAAVV